MEDIKSPKEILTRSLEMDGLLKDHGSQATPTRRLPEALEEFTLALAPTAVLGPVETRRPVLGSLDHGSLATLVLATLVTLSSADLTP